MSEPVLPFWLTVLDKIGSAFTLAIVTFISWFGSRHIKRIDDMEKQVKDMSNTMVSHETLNYTIDGLKDDMRAEFTDVKSSIVELRSTVLQSIRDNQYNGNHRR